MNNKKQIIYTYKSKRAAEKVRKIKNQRLTKRKQNYIIIIVLNRTLIRQYNKEEKYVFLGSA